MMDGLWRRRPSSSSRRLLYALVVLLALALPFELIRPTLPLPLFGLQLTNLELLLAATAMIWLAGGDLGFLRPLLWPALAFITVSLLAAVLAPEYRLEALKFSGRLTLGLLVMGVVGAGATTPARRQGLLWALLAGGSLSALLGLGEWFNLPWLDPLWSYFKASPSRVGGSLRLSASFQYATIAAMFWEMTIPLGLALAATGQPAGRRRLALALTLLCTVAAVLTLTRTSLLTLGLIVVFMLLLSYLRPSLRPLRTPALWTGLTLLLLVGWLIWQADAFRIRLLTEDDQQWYDAAYLAPAALTLQPGEETAVTITVYNRGQATWWAQGNYAFALGYRWLDDQKREIAGHGEVALPHNVPPHQEATLRVPLRAPLEAGDYHLSWGMLQRQILWFRHREVPEVATRVTVGPLVAAPDLSPAPPVAATDIPLLPVTVPRRALWRAAAQMIQERPLLGHGPDTFRHRYGRYLGMAHWDDRIHANNLYLEMLVSVGLLGSAAFGWLLVAAIRPLGAVLTGAAPPATNGAGRLAADRQIRAAGLSAALLAFFVHGLLDYFLGFLGLYWLFWFVVALGYSSHAYRPYYPWL